MNVSTTTTRIVARSANDARQLPVQRTVLPTREFGVGYGSSSGYVGRERYTRDWGNARFRFA